MSDAMRVYTKMQTALKKFLTNVSQARLEVMALMMSALVRKGECHLTQLARVAPSKAKTESTHRRFQRFLSCDGVESSALMVPFAHPLLHAFEGKTLRLALDVSQIGRGCVVLMLGLLYKGRLLPLTWQVEQGEKGHWSALKHVAFAEQVKQLLGDRKDVVLLGDGEYDNIDFLRYLSRECGWDFVVRTAKNTLLHQAHEEKPQQIQYALPVKEGQTLSASECKVTAQAFGPLHAVAHWKLKQKQPWYLLSTFPEPHHSLNLYRKRFLIETFFSDQKSRGFRIDKSHLSCPLRLSRLLLLCCLSYLWLVYLGIRLVAEGKVDEVDRSKKRQDKSLFQIGFSWLERQLKNGGRFRISFELSQRLVLADIWLARYESPHATVM
ncbi:MAG: IS4 family transposase [Myxococcales bacterium]|nr:IS4 family transposase [Myxococcales bacterium]